MKLATLRTPGPAGTAGSNAPAATRAVRLDERAGVLVDLDAPDLGDFLASRPDWRRRAQEATADAGRHADDRDAEQVEPAVAEPGGEHGALEAADTHGDEVAPQRDREGGGRAHPPYVPSPGGRAFVAAVAESVAH